MIWIFVHLWQHLGNEYTIKQIMILPAGLRALDQNNRSGVLYPMQFPWSDASSTVSVGVPLSTSIAIFTAFRHSFLSALSLRLGNKSLYCYLSSSMRVFSALPFQHSSTGPYLVVNALQIKHVAIGCLYREASYRPCDLCDSTFLVLGLRVAYQYVLVKVRFKSFIAFS